MKRRSPSTMGNGKPAAGSGAGAMTEVTRDVPERVATMLWGRAAGRCEFLGCNRPLWKSSVTQEEVNVAQKAHIYAFSAAGPRGNAGVAKATLNSVENLMLVCHACHRTIDQQVDGGRYPATLLQQWKAEHERRIEVVTGIDPARRSHVLLYGSNIGEHSSPLRFADAAQAMFPRHYPADDRGIVLGTINSAFTDRDAGFWRCESQNLVTQFERRIRERIAVGEIEHLSVFAIAPQPLLILLGTLLIDITPAEVYQRHREPATWQWPERARQLSYVVEEPEAAVGPPALVLALSAPVTDDRVTGALGDDAAIWRVTVPRPHNDVIKSRAHLSEFRGVIRELLDRIKAKHGQNAPLHVFPVMGVSPSIEFGRVRMPKAHMPWIVYDQVNACGGFIPALSLPLGE